MTYSTEEKALDAKYHYDGMGVAPGMKIKASDPFMKKDTPQKILRQIAEEERRLIEEANLARRIAEEEARLMEEARR